MATDAVPFGDIYNSVGIATGLTSASASVASLPTVYNSVSDPTATQSLTAGYITGDISSANFSTGVAGWKLSYLGNLEANNGNFRGDLTGATGTFTGTLTGGSLNVPDLTTANSFHVDTTGNAWWGTNIATGYATAPAKVLKDGSATFTNITITGGSIAGSTITALSITAGQITNNTITATQIANNTITATQIANNTVTASQIANATITSSQISGTAGITGSQIASATIAGSNIANNAVTATQIANNTVTASQIANLTITAGQIANLTITSGKVNTALMSYNHNLVFSVDGSAPSTTVDWASGTITTSDGTSYSISAGNTGVMAAKTFVYLDTATSLTVLQKTTTLATAVGDGKMLIAVAQNNTTECIFQVFNGIGGTNLAGSSIVAGSITANEIAATTITASQIAANTITASQIASGTITATQITVTSLSSLSANLGSITAGTIVLPSGGYIRSGQTAFNTGTGFYLGNDSSTPRFSIGDGSANTLTWDGTTMNYSGASRITWKASTMFEAITRYPTFQSGKYQIAIDAGLYLRMADSGGNTQASSYIGFYMTMGPSAGILAFNSCSFSAEVHMRNAPAGAGQFFVGVTDAGFEAGSSMNFAGHKQYGFKVIEVAGTMTLYSTNANGSSETTTNLMTINQGEAHLLSASISGSSIKFYVDNTLAATHSTNLPSSSQTTQNIGYFALNNNGANNAYDWVISSYNFEKTAGFL